MDYDKISKIEGIYADYLAVLETAGKAEKQYAAELMGPGEDEYHNPFRMSYDFEKAVSAVRDDVVRAVKRTFNDEYPNVDLEKMDFKNLFSKGEYGRHDGLAIDWNGMRLRLLWLEGKADELAMNGLNETALKTIPNAYYRPELKLEELLRGKTVQLDGHFHSYGRVDEYALGRLRKWLAVVLEDARASQATGTNKAEIKCYKNGRTDLKFGNEEEAKKTAEALLNLWTAKNKKT